MFDGVSTQIIQVTDIDDNSFYYQKVIGKRIVIYVVSNFCISIELLVINYSNSKCSNNNRCKINLMWSIVFMFKLASIRDQTVFLISVMTITRMIVYNTT